MRLNTLAPADGARKDRVRVGRGIGSGLGKTCGRGHKGQFARAGKGKVKAGFEGGQMPLQRRLPKVGFRSRTARDCAEVFLYQLSQIPSDVIDFTALVESGLVDSRAVTAKIIMKGLVDRKLTIRGLAVTAGARSAIEAAGGAVE